MYNAEARAILEGLRQALNSLIARLAPRIHICLDNLGVAHNADGVSKGSSQKVFREFRDLAKDWLQSSKQLTIQWIPGHTGIEKNKLADQEARIHVKRVPISGLNLQHTFNSATQNIQMRKDSSWQLKWQNSTFSRAA